MTPFTWSVAAAVSMMKKATTFEKPMPKTVSNLMRDSCSWAVRARSSTALHRLRHAALPLRATLPKEQVGTIVVPKIATTVVRKQVLEKSWKTVSKARGSRTRARRTRSRRRQRVPT